MKRCLLTAAALCALAGPASAGPGDWSYTAVAENDVFDYSPDHTDRYYTHGTQISGTSGPIPCQTAPWAAHFGVFFEKAQAACETDVKALKADAKGPNKPIIYRWGLELGQNIYTPASKTPRILPKDRPYAGWAYGGLTFGSYSPKEANTVELQLGVVGPSSGAAWVQDHFHDLIHAARFNGWNHQLKDEVAFVILGERRWAAHRLWPRDPPDKSSPALDSTDHLDFALGTVQDSLALGRIYRFGIGLDADAGPPRIRPAPSGSQFIVPDGDWSAYVFAGLDGRLVARDVFLDGNTFQDSLHVQKRPLVGEATTGAAIRWRGLRIAYTYIWQSEEFLGQRGPQKFGSWSLTLVPYAF